MEPAATNLALHSRDLTNAVWSGTNVTRAKNAVGADGVASGATTLTATAASGTVLQALSHASQNRIFSAYVRRVTGTGAIQMTTNGGTNWDTVTISSLYTQVACVARASTASGTVGFRMAVSGDVIEVDFTQGEVGPAFTSPIPTTAGTGSRSADVISVTGAVSGSIGQTEGVLYIECESNDGLDDVIFINQVVTNSIVLTKNGNNSYIGQIYHSSNIITFTSASGVTGMVKIAIAYKSGDSTMYLNGSRVGTLNTNAITFGAALNRIGVSKSPFFAGAKPSRIRAVALYTTRLTDAELGTLTTP